jgi:RsiW-degrading membrane proteinase PrsW (M82 family)
MDRNSIFGATMNRNFLYLLVGALIVGVGVLGYSFYQERQKPGLSISIGGKEGLRIEGK